MVVVCVGSTGARIGDAFGVGFFVFFDLFIAIIAPLATAAKQQQQQPAKAHHCQICMKEPYEPDALDPMEPVEPIETELDVSSEVEESVLKDPEYKEAKLSSEASDALTAGLVYDENKESIGVSVVEATVHTTWPAQTVTQAAWAASCATLAGPAATASAAASAVQAGVAAQFLMQVWYTPSEAHWPAVPAAFAFDAAQALATAMSHVAWVPTADAARTKQAYL